ncbi:EDM2-like protein1 [Actinidia rufa]|uniref:EDM2-like protein1 n=1 Tax=Actinidia rufa TaxID=165716 RepID=A0A7J0DF96_9ERIC|nr:EDM2-like protein1 [Actinidia rufa]
MARLLTPPSHHPWPIGAPARPVEGHRAKRKPFEVKSTLIGVESSLVRSVSKQISHSHSPRRRLTIGSAFPTRSGRVSDEIGASFRQASEKEAPIRGSQGDSPPLCKIPATKVRVSPTDEKEELSGNKWRFYYAQNGCPHCYTFGHNFACAFHLLRNIIVLNIHLLVKACLSHAFAVKGLLFLLAILKLSDSLFSYLEIVDRLHWYVQDGDMNDFSFEKRDWMSVCLEELPAGSRLIMGLNPPFGVHAAIANQFIAKALTFKPKLIILIVPRETKRILDDVPEDFEHEEETSHMGKLGNEEPLQLEDMCMDMELSTPRNSLGYNTVPELLLECHPNGALGNRAEVNAGRQGLQYLQPNFSGARLEFGTEHPMFHTTVSNGTEYGYRQINKGELLSGAYNSSTGTNYSLK